MSQSKSGGGAVIVAVIVLGAAYVSYGMFKQPGQDSGTMPKLPNFSHKASVYLQSKENPYVAALLAPPDSANNLAERERFSQLLHDKLGAKSEQSLNETPVSGAPVSGAPVNETPVSQNISDTGAQKHIDNLMSAIAAASDKGDFETGLAKVKEAAAFALANPVVTARARIDIALSGGRLSYLAHDFDQSRQYICQAVALAHQNQDYKIEDLEGLRCILNGNGSEAQAYDICSAQFSESLSKSDFDRLPSEADNLITAAKALPEDSFFRLQAQLSKATAMVYAKKNVGETKQYITKVQALALKAQDSEVGEECARLLAKLEKQ
jgi:hypothetical protein